MNKIEKQMHLLPENWNLLKRVKRNFRIEENNLLKLRAQKKDLAAEQRNNELEDLSVDKLHWDTEKKMEKIHKEYFKIYGTQ